MKKPISIKSLQSDDSKVVQMVAELETPSGVVQASWTQRLIASTKGGKDEA